MKQIAVKVTPEEHRAFSVLAAGRSLSRSALASQLIRAFLKRHGKEGK